MFPLQRILCPIDFSSDSRSALTAAGEMAQLFSAQLIVLHVYESHAPTTWPYGEFGINPMTTTLSKEETLALREKDLDAEVQTVLPEGLDLKLVVRIGAASEEIIEEARARRSDMIVIAPHGHGRLHKAVFGSTAAKVVRQSPCPVVTMHTSRESEGKPKGRGKKKAQA